MIYLDNNATTRPAPEVIEYMQHVLEECYGNPSSLHAAGRAALRKLTTAREEVAQLLHCAPTEVFFTSGGTEGNNWALRGIWESVDKSKKDHLVTTAVEHASVRQVIAYLQRDGLKVTELKVDRQGRLDPDEVRAAITPRTFMLSCIMANNETGVIFPVETLGELAKEQNLLFHVDAVQAVGKQVVDLQKLSTIDLLTFSGHKLHAPKGVGGLFIRRQTRCLPLLWGGHQEEGLRAGTENLVSIAGFGKAAILAADFLQKGLIRSVACLRDRLEQGILNRFEDTAVNGDPASRLPNTSHIAFRYLDGNALLIALDDRGIAVSAGAACSSKSIEPSHVLKAMGVLPNSLYSSVRFSLSRYTTEAEIDAVLAELTVIIKELRSISPFFLYK